MQDFRIGDQVQMRKQHPCGSDIWVIYRVGADIGLRCAGCGRRVMLARSVFLRRLKRVLSPTVSKRES
ncbi:MAG: DUF951 domain-containing protein [Aggregatilineales bacterium]